mmetsp:Transcript_43651/g.68349  ORF Transcript_43651/g.68349 Transcript_43651/m.68349 type:complete len:98 (-) Transcript_43651:788-1081(-)
MGILYRSNTDGTCGAVAICVWFESNLFDAVACGTVAVCVWFESILFDAVSKGPESCASTPLRPWNTILETLKEILRIVHAPRSATNKTPPASTRSSM